MQINSKSQSLLNGVKKMHFPKQKGEFKKKNQKFQFNNLNSPKSKMNCSLFFNSQNREFLLNTKFNIFIIKKKNR